MRVITAVLLMLVGTPALRIKSTVSAPLPPSAAHRDYPPPRGLQHTIEGNLLKIEKVQVESRSFKFDYITTQRSLSRSITAASTAASAGGFGGLGTVGLGTPGIGAAVPVTGNVGGTPFGF